jgi:choline-phosphate cytidylyltransferase
MNIYLDGIFDLFHRGHLESIKQIKTLYPNCYLIVGVISDEDALSYKRLPIISFEDRCEIIKSIKYVDKVIEKSPLIIDKKFLSKYFIDLVVHGFSSIEDEKNQLCFFEELIKLGKFEKVPYYDKISTTEIINRINTI